MSNGRVEALRKQAKVCRNCGQPALERASKCRKCGDKLVPRTWRPQSRSKEERHPERGRRRSASSF